MQRVVEKFQAAIRSMSDCYFKEESEIAGRRVKSKYERAIEELNYNNEIIVKTLGQEDNGMMEDLVEDTLGQLL